MGRLYFQTFFVMVLFHLSIVAAIPNLGPPELCRCLTPFKTGLRSCICHSAAQTIRATRKVNWGFSTDQRGDEVDGKNVPQGNQGDFQWPPKQYGGELGFEYNTPPKPEPVIPWDSPLLSPPTCDISVSFQLSFVADDSAQVYMCSRKLTQTGTFDAAQKISPESLCGDLLFRVHNVALSSALAVYLVRARWYHVRYARTQRTPFAEWGT